MCHPPYIVISENKLFIPSDYYKIVLNIHNRSSVFHNPHQFILGKKYKFSILVSDNGSAEIVGYDLLSIGKFHF